MEEVESELNSHIDDLSECPFCGSRLKGFVSIENECPNKDYGGGYIW